MHHVFDSMGTTVSLDWHEHGTHSGADAAARVERIFDEFDRRFSLYRTDSEASRIAAGRLRLADSSDAMREAYALALEWRTATGGVFTPNRPDGVVDLSGVVKALAIERSGELLGASDRNGDWIVNAGGDVLVSAPRTVGIVDPADRGSLLTAVTLTGTRRAVATSGSAERGDHIWRSAADEFVQATVLADDIVTADVLATAIIAGGTETLDAVTRRWNVDVLTVDATGALLATPGFRASLA